ncbi:MAG: hypothetical protein GKR96_04125 [Gammaproteobacteria bacterium]|nr:hypothetical protein [Gammaproteobacteria bacterium]
MVSNHDDDDHAPFTDTLDTLPISFTEYLELLDWSSRILREDKSGAVNPSMPNILGRLGDTKQQWASQLRPRSPWRPKAVGSPDALAVYCESIGQKWVCQRHNTRPNTP